MQTFNISPGITDPKQKVEEIRKQLEQGIHDLFNSDKFKDFLISMSKFRTYSINNQVLIFMQKKDAELVASYTDWNKNFDRKIIKGSKAIKIFAPIMKKIKDITDLSKIDPQGLKDPEELVLVGFKAVNVFDISQTEGKPLPELSHNLTDNVKNFDQAKKALISISPLPVYFEEISGHANGYCSAEKIVIKNDLSQSQMLKTMVHEISHSMLHFTEGKTLERSRKEVEAESIAFIVCNYFGLDTSDYSFGYVAGWSKDKELSQLKASISVIRDTANKIISSVEKELVIEDKSKNRGLPSLAEKIQQAKDRKQDKIKEKEDIPSIKKENNIEI
ncbi:MAG: hypothetical protein KHZ87_04730 [Clostridiales bacterium]|nr:hypothetical protein [Clostridiales bacterium]MBS5877832.1 hypothetical protein [Clostridiales bacterium]